MQNIMYIILAKNWHGNQVSETNWSVESPIVKDVRYFTNKPAIEQNESFEKKQIETNIRNSGKKTPIGTD